MKCFVDPTRPLDWGANNTRHTGRVVSGALKSLETAFSLVTTQAKKKKPASGKLKSPEVDFCFEQKEALCRPFPLDLLGRKYYHVYKMRNGFQITEETRPKSLGAIFNTTDHSSRRKITVSKEQRVQKPLFATNGIEHFCTPNPPASLRHKYYRAYKKKRLPDT